MLFAARKSSLKNVWVANQILQSGRGKPPYIGTLSESFSSTPFQTHLDDLSLKPMLVNNKKINYGCNDNIKFKN